MTPAQTCLFSKLNLEQNLRIPERNRRKKHNTLQTVSTSGLGPEAVGPMWSWVAEKGGPMWAPRPEAGGPIWAPGAEVGGPTWALGADAVAPVWGPDSEAEVPP